MNPITTALEKNKYTKVVSILFNARTNAHIMHLQTKSYAQHIALNEYYSGVLDLADKFAESAQGTQGILQGYILGDVVNTQPSAFIKSVMMELLKCRAYFDSKTEGHLIQLIDDMVELHTSTVYKLDNLK